MGHYTPTIALNMTTMLANPKAHDETGWKQQHDRAVLNPCNHHEEALVLLLRGWGQYAADHKTAYHSLIGHDGVLGPQWGRIGEGRKDASCERCCELLAGAPVRQWAWAKSAKMRRAAAETETEMIRAHFAPGGPHSRGDCGPVCTAFDW